MVCIAVRRRSAAAVAAAIALLASTGACSPQPNGGDDLKARQTAYFAGLADEARESGASRTQIQALDDAAETGTLTAEMVTELYDPLFECFAALGGTGEIFGTASVAPGIEVPDYRVGFDAEVDAAGGDDLTRAVKQCEDTHVAFVWRALYLQPIAVDARNAAMMASVDTIRACLDALGIALPSDPSPDDVMRGISDGQAQGTQCYSEPDSANG